MALQVEHDDVAAGTLRDAELVKHIRIVERDDGDDDVVVDDRCNHLLRDLAGADLMIGAIDLAVGCTRCGSDDVLEDIIRVLADVEIMCTDGADDEAARHGYLHK